MKIIFCQKRPDNTVTSCYRGRDMKTVLKFFSYITTIPLTLFLIAAICCCCADKDTVPEPTESSYSVTGAQSSGNKDILTVSRDVAMFDLYPIIHVAEGYEFVISHDLNGKDKVTGEVTLAPGDNIFFVTVTAANTLDVHELVVHRNKMFTLLFDLAGGEGEIPEQKVEEGSLAVEPDVTPSRVGYDFAGWDYDFTTKVQKSQYIEAIWIQKTDIPYALEVYISEHGNEYVKVEELCKTYDNGCTGSRVYADIDALSFLEDEYLLMDRLSVTEAVIAGDGSTKLCLYYNRQYEVNGVVTAAYDTVHAGNTTAVLKCTESEQEYALRIENGQISGRAVTGEYMLTVRVAGYKTIEQEVTVTEAGAELGTIEAKTMDFGSAAPNGTAVTGAGYEEIDAGVEYVTGRKGTGAWVRNTAEGSIQLPGNSDTPVYFNGFASDSYVAGANIVLKVRTDNIVLADWGQRIAGIVVNDGTYQLGIYMLDDGFRVMDGKYWDNRFVTCTGYGINFQDIEENRGYRFMSVMREGETLTVSLEGQAVLRLSATDGVKALWEGAEYTYSDVNNDGNGFSEQGMKELLSEMLVEGREHAVGFGGMYNANGSNNMLFESYFVTTDLTRGQALVEGLSLFSGTRAVTLGGQRLNGIEVNGAMVGNASVYAYIGDGSGFMKEGAYAYAVQTETLYNNVGKQDQRHRNQVYMNTVMRGGYTFGADVDFSASTYYQAGLTISDGSNYLYVGQFAENDGICINYYTTPTQGVAENRTTVKKVGITGLTGANHEDVIKRIEIERSGAAIKIYMSEKDAEGRETLARKEIAEITEEGISSPIAGAEISGTSGGIGAVAKALLENDNVCGFGNLVGGTAADFPCTIYSSVSLTQTAY